MEVPKYWRSKQQRYGLMGEICLKCDVKIFPPRPKHKCDKNLVFDSNLLLPPDHKIVHREVVGQNQE